MKTKCLWFLVPILILYVTRTPAQVVKEGDSSLSRITFFKSLELESISSLSLESGGNPIVRITGGQNEKQILVILVKRSFRFRGMKVIDDKRASFEPSGSLNCYELRSKNTDDLFAWSFWSPSACGCFTLLNDTQTGTHLAFVRGPDVFIGPVDAPRDSASELTVFMMNGWKFPPNFMRVPISDLISRDEFHGLNALYNDDIRIDSLSISKQRISLGLSSRSTQKRFSLQYDGQDWNRR